MLKLSYRCTQEVWGARQKGKSCSRSETIAKSNSSFFYFKPQNKRQPTASCCCCALSFLWFTMTNLRDLVRFALL